MADVSVSILSVEKENATHTFYNLETARPEYFHIDVMDGKFVENNNLELMKDYATTISHISNIPLDVHLMVENVEEIMDEYMDLLPDRITFHIEAISDSERIFNIIDDLKSNGIKIGIAIKPNTKIDEIKPYLNYIHQILVMTVEPGKGGQKLIPETLEKSKELRSFVDDNGIDIDIEADGGINKETAEDVRNAGTDVLVSGAFIINSEDQREAVEIIRGTK